MVPAAKVHKEFVDTTCVQVQTGLGRQMGQQGMQVWKAGSGVPALVLLLGVRASLSVTKP
jgi:hypothetical protein